MTQTRFPNAVRARTIVTTLFLLVVAATAAPAQNTADKVSTTPKTTAAAATDDKVKAPARPDEKAEQVIERAVAAMGGRAFLDVRTVTSRGYYTPFQEGDATLPSSFVDYMVFPDRERTEFRSQGVRMIQTYTGETGWIFDGMGRKLLDVKPEQAKDFRLAMRTSIDNILRGWWRTEGAQLQYVGRREAGLAKRNEVVRLTYTDGFTVEFEFGAKDFLPAKALYKKQNAEGDEVAEEDHYAQYLTIGGVSVPFVIDHFRAGQQSSRVNYEAVDFNRPVPDSLFARPTDIKALK